MKALAASDSFIQVQRRVSGAGVPAAVSLRAWSSAALPRKKAGELTIRIVGVDESRELNHQYRHKDKPTNVLSFPGDEVVPGLRVLGDIVICAEVVAREAAEQGKAPRAHWAHMVVHGCLHLLGYDHETDAEAETMETREREILAGLGFPDPYQADHDAIEAAADLPKRK